MCGICGIVNFNREHYVEKDTLQKMCDVIRHRGQDDEGFFVSQNVGLGMRRLSIIDLTGGAQPIFNENKTVCVVSNGEIYNYLELRQLLEKFGHHFRTRSDTEVIVHAYEQWGNECPKMLRGMFAFAVWDEEKKKLFIARDRMGQKPLYYYVDDRMFLFSSEIKTILKHHNVPRYLNIKALNVFLTLGYVPTPNTMFDRIFKLPAGHTLCLTKRSLLISEYWDLKFGNKKSKNLSDYRERLLHLLKDSVHAHLVSDRPIGAFLSGGIDSSMVVGLMSQMMNKPIDTFSVGFEDDEFNELPFARIISQHFSTNHHEIVVNSCDSDLLEKLVWHMDEPVADPAAVPTYLLSELASKNVSVVLTGEGGDEMFAGYDYYKASLKNRRYQILPNNMSRLFLPALARRVNSMLRRQRYHERTIWFWSLPLGKQMAAWVSVFTNAEKDKLLSRTFNHYMIEEKTAEVFAHFYDKTNTKDNLHRLMYIDSKVWLPDNLLMKVDKMSMAFSLEARVPFLDHHLIEFVATIPSHLKLNGSKSKLVLKEIAKNILPEEIIFRPKKTFDVPIGKWLKGDLRDLALDLIYTGIVSDEELFDKEYILSEMWNGLERDRPGYARQFWSLINLGLWYRQFNVRTA